MGNRDKQRYLYYIFRSNNSVYLKEKAILDIVKDYNYFEINGNNQMSFIEPLQKFINDSFNEKKVFIIINTDDISIDSQKMLSFMVKDKSYQTVFLPDNCKIIVTGNKDKMYKKLYGLLVALDV
ncbi:MAG: hypothetical protein IKF19_06190 [Bacilli bacterium]|nr:hypothetical protein [Bacilli bacterium]